MFSEGKVLKILRSTVFLPLTGAFVLSASMFVAMSTTVSAAENSPESLESIVSTMSKEVTLQADVQQTNTIVGVGNETFSGKVYIQYGEKAYWGYTNPSAQIYLIEGDNVIYYDELLEQVYITNKKQLGDDLLLGLMSDVNSLVRDFKVTPIKNKAGAFTLVPKKESSTIKNVEVYTKSGTIQRVKSYDYKGNVIEMVFSNVVTGKKISKDKFTIKYPEDVQIIRR